MTTRITDGVQDRAPASPPATTGETHAEAILSAIRNVEPPRRTPFIGNGAASRDANHFFIMGRNGALNAVRNIIGTLEGFTGNTASAQPMLELLDIIATVPTPEHDPRFEGVDHDARIRRATWRRARLDILREARRYVAHISETGEPETTNEKLLNAVTVHKTELRVRYRSGPDAPELFEEVPALLTDEGHDRLKRAFGLAGSLQATTCLPARVELRTVWSSVAPDGEVLSSTTTQWERVLSE